MTEEEEVKKQIDLEGFEDVLGSGGIHKKVLKASEGIQAEYGEEVTVRYSEWLLDSDKRISENVEQTFRVGDSEVIPALELIGKMIHMGEIVEVRCQSRFGYGDKGLEGIVPPGSSLKLIIELLQVVKKRTEELDSKELILEATKKKESGNRFFKEKNYDQAAKMYKKALNLLETWEHNEEDANKCKELLIAIGNNVANVQEKLEKFKEAKQSSMEVLQIDPQNIKAIYRLGQVSLRESELKQAIEYVKHGLFLEPQNRTLRELFTQIKEKQQQKNEEEKQKYSKMIKTKNNKSKKVHETNSSATTTPTTSRQNEVLRQYLVPLFAAIAAILTYFFMTSTTS